jgi:putative ABC transport system substrate-binding protein
MRRREFMTLLAGSAASWPLAARAQQPPLIGFLQSASAGATAHMLAAFHSGLSQAAVLAATGGDSAVLAAKAATATIPIVFTIGSDPVALGYVASLNRPGGNVTGVALLTSNLGAKRIGLLGELIPNASAIGVLDNPTNPVAAAQLKEVQAVRTSRNVR